MSKKAIETAARYRRKYWREVDFSIFETYHFNAFSNPLCPIITSNEHIQAFNWGLIPFWTKTIEDAKHIRTKTYNARAETLFEKPSYRSPIKSKRCIIPSTGYFEYHHNQNKTTTPYFIYLKNEEIFSIGGIYDEWTDKETGEILQTFSLITTEANPFTGEIHNGGKNPHRMPLILNKEDEEKWLDPELKKDDIISLLKPFGEKEMDAYPVNADFIHKDWHDKSIIDKM